MPVTSIFDQLYILVTFIDSVLSIVLALSAIYILATKGKAVKKLFTLLTNYSLHKTINELHDKLNRINAYSGDDKTPSVKKEIINIFQEVRGQIDGNIFLKNEFIEDFEELKEYLNNNKKLTEADKRYLVTKLREKLETFNVKLFNDLAGKGDE